jgi:hypothetical protein
MSHELLIQKLVNALEQLAAAGDRFAWPSDEIASVAIRRWESYSRRFKKPNRVTFEERLNDLAKGLAAHFEPDIPYTHPADWRGLAKVLADVLNADSN